MSADSYDGPTWVEYCQYCGEKLTRGEGAFVCTDPENCPDSEGGDGACGFLVCEAHHHPIRDLGRRGSA
jgi:hypothetical protein